MTAEPDLDDLTRPLHPEGDGFRAACARAGQQAREAWAAVRRIVRAWWARVVAVLRPVLHLLWRLASAEARRRVIRMSCRHDSFAYRSRRMLCRRGGGPR